MPTQPSKSGQGAETEIQPRGWRIGGLLYSACIRVPCRGVDFRIGNSSALLPDHFSVSDGALFIILIKTIGQYFIFQYLASKLNSIACDIDGPCTFPHFNFSYFYLYKEGNFGSIGNVSRDGILFVA